MIEMHEYKDLTDFPAEHSLQINTCGIRRVVDHDLCYLRSHGRKDYLLLYIRHGSLTVWFGDTIQTIGAGKCLLYMPGVTQKYIYTKSNDPVVLYCHFTGKAADEATSIINPHNKVVFDIHDKTVFAGLFYQLTQIYYAELFRTNHKPIFHLEANGVLIQLLSMLETDSLRTSTHNENAILVASQHFIKHFHDQIDINEYAQTLNLSTSRFSHLFTQHVGISPHKFILNLRVDEAKELLSSTNLTIAEIATQVGFSDVSYFTRLFLNYVGVTPSAYRKKY